MHADSEQSQSPLATQRVIDCQNDHGIQRNQRGDHKPGDDPTNCIKAPFVAIEESIKPRPIPVPRGIAGGNQICEHRKPGGKNPIEITSPWRGAKVDEVRQLPEARIEVKTDANGYTVKASLALSDLGVSLESGEELRADFGVTFGDALGTDTNLRSCWSNQSTGLVDDIPGEIMFSPNLWGKMVVKQA